MWQRTMAARVGSQRSAAFVLSGAAVTALALLAFAVTSMDASAQSPGASPSPLTTPTAQPTPWPPPPNLGVKGGCTITDATGASIPPPERQCSLLVVWAHLPGFTGVYEVELQIQPWNPPPDAYKLVATIPASAIVDGEGRFDDAFGFADAMGTVRCYRIRTVINGATGPYTNPACESFAGVADGGVPNPPDTGAGLAGSGDGVPMGSLAAGLAAIAAGFTAWVFAVHRRSAS